MSASGDDQLPDDLVRDLHGLVPDAPASMSSQERETLVRAGMLARRTGDRRFGAWLAAIAAAALVLIGVAVWQFTVRAPAPQQVAVAKDVRPTIVDALRAAKLRKARQVDVDQIAMAAVQLERAEVQ